MGARIDAEAGLPLAAEGVEVHFVFGVAGEVGGLGGGRVDAVLELGALFGDCGDFFLVVGELELETVCAGEGKSAIGGRRGKGERKVLL